MIESFKLSISFLNNYFLSPSLFVSYRRLPICKFASSGSSIILFFVWILSMTWIFISISGMVSSKYPSLMGPVIRINKVVFLMKHQSGQSYLWSIIIHVVHPSMPSWSNLSSDREPSSVVSEFYPSSSVFI